MSSFRTSVTPHRRSAARFVESVRRRLVAAYADQPEVTQTAIAAKLGIHRSVVSRQFRGVSDMSLGRVAELSWCLGYEPSFGLVRIEEGSGNHAPSTAPQFTKVVVGATSATINSKPRALEPAE